MSSSLKFRSDGVPNEIDEGGSSVEMEQNLLNRMDNLSIRRTASPRIQVNHEQLVNDVQMAFNYIFSNPPADEGMLDIITASSDIKGEYRDLWPGIVQLFSPSAHRIIAFVKRIVGFSDLNSTDQIILLRCCVMDILFFRMGIKYDPQNHSLPMRNGNRVQRKQASTLYSGALWPFLGPLFNTAEAVSKLSLSVTEAALAIAVIAVETDRIGLTDKGSVLSLQRKLKEAAQHHVERANPDLGRWSRIQAAITSVRAVSIQNAPWLLSRNSFNSVCQLSIQMLEDAY
ncbi:thyroid hormone receptor alpha-like isoform X1 [Palaemon carinicauda]|uniref:thyroid hormone receptor alpha-like isoform X1 n=1 Tax=Palaemon carinicauda TaxID=392227 RepID=UPI0035B67119